MTAHPDPCDVCGHTCTDLGDGWRVCGCCGCKQRDEHADAVVGKAMLQAWHNREGAS